MMRMERNTLLLTRLFNEPVEDIAGLVADIPVGVSRVFSHLGFEVHVSREKNIEHPCSIWRLFYIVVIDRLGQTKYCGRTPIDKIYFQAKSPRPTESVITVEGTLKEWAEIIKKLRERKGLCVPVV